MKKLTLIAISIFWLCNLHSQNWVNIIDSMPNSHLVFNSGVVDSVNNVMYLGGDFQQINNLRTKAIIKYDGVKFDTLGAGLDPQWKSFFSATQLKKTIMFKNKLYVSGQFEQAGKYYCPNLASWNGVAWDSIKLLSHLSSAWHMTVYNNELYVGGYFDSIGGIKCRNIAKYDGVNWHDIGYSYPNCVTAIENYKGKLYMAGEVSAGSSCANLAYYDGISWHPWFGILGGVAKNVTGMKVINNKLFVYGQFKAIGGVQCNGIASWDGTKWVGYGKGVIPSNWATVRDITQINGELYASGTFDTINDVGNLNGEFNFHTNIAKFDGTKWCTFSEPFNNGLNFSIKYKNEMFVAGAFNEIGSHVSVLPLLKWTGGNYTINCGKTVEFPPDDVIPPISHIAGVYPNPTNGLLNIYDDELDLPNTTIKITNNLGQMVLSINYIPQIDVSSLASGMYYLTIQDGSHQKIVKIIKQ